MRIVANPFSSNENSTSNKYYHPYPPISIEPLKSFSKTFTDTSRLFISFNSYLDLLLRAQVTRDQVLSFNKMMDERKQVNKSLVDGERSINKLKPPYEIE